MVLPRCWTTPSTLVSLPQMRTARECLAKAADMDRQAERCPTSVQSADYRSMAESWRAVARQAQWQDLADARIVGH
jgi:hypothetical protein